MITPHTTHTHAIHNCNMHNQHAHSTDSTQTTHKIHTTPDTQYTIAKFLVQIKVCKLIIITVTVKHNILYYLIYNAAVLVQCMFYVYTMQAL